MTTLISFLGRGRREQETNRYQRATYRFDDGRRASFSYFGLALADYLKVRKLVILGTAGSIWDVFAEDLVDDEAAIDQLAEIGLNGAVADQNVDQDVLDRLAPLLRAKIGIHVEPVLIPYARNTEDQLQVLRSMAEHVEDHEPVVLDVTHGYRHLPMLALVAARFLSRVRRVIVKDIYYGALEMTEKTTGETPVISLRGLLRMLDWVDALATYDKDGDYGVFTPLLKADGMPQQRAALLESAAFFERTSNPVRARETLGSVFPAVEQHAGPMGSLFRDELAQRLSWIRNSRRSQWELSLADAYLARKDYVRATMFMQEARISWEVERRNQDVNDINTREKWRKQCQDDKADFKKLTSLRNALAHGVRSTDKEITQFLQDENTLRATLGALRKTLMAS